MQQLRTLYPATLTWLQDCGEAGNFAGIDARHDFVQLLFPTDISSQFSHPWATLTRQDILAWQQDADFYRAAQNAVDWMLYYWGLAVRQAEVVFIDRGRFRQYFLFGGHNHRRISRVLRFVRLLDLPQRGALDSFAGFLAARTANIIPETTMNHWLGLLP